jgi:hypothetical protein
LKAPSIVEESCYSYASDFTVITVRTPQKTYKNPQLSQLINEHKLSLIAAFANPTRSLAVLRASATQGANDSYLAASYFQNSFESCGK